MASKAPYYLTPKAAPYAVKPYDRRRANRDRHDSHNLSYKLSAATRRVLRRQRLAPSPVNGGQGGDS